MRPPWRIRPDCKEEGCEKEAVNKRGWSIEHHPNRCTAHVTEVAANRADGTVRCRAIARKGQDKCWMHLK